MLLEIMKKTLALFILVSLLAGCGVNAVKEGYTPYKNKNGEEVAVIRYVNFYNKKSTTSSPAGNVGQGVASLIGATPIVGDLAGRAIAAATGPSGNEEWVAIQFARGLEGDDWKRIYPAVMRPAWPAAHLLKEKQWVRYTYDPVFVEAEGRSGKPSDLFPCDFEADCLPLSL